MVKESRNYVVARQGIIARIQDWYDDADNFFLIDALIFPGNSGGPVLAKPTMFSYGTNFSAPKLIGMVSGYLPFRDIAVSIQTGREVLVTMENSGLATIVPLDIIEETMKTAIIKAGKALPE